MPKEWPLPDAAQAEGEAVGGEERRNRNVEVVARDRQGKRLASH